MLKKISSVALLILSIALFACNNSGKKETPASIAKEWCELDAKVNRAEGAAKEAAKEAREKFEQKMDEKYGKDEAFYKQIEEEVEKCENK